MKKFVLLIAILLLMLPISAAQIPTISSYVTDKAGILSSSTKSSLEADLRDIEKQTNGIQFVIYIENEYPKEYSIEEYALKIAEQNNIGKKGNDNGILFYLAVKDRQYRWEVGYGVESTLNSPLLGRISREFLVPNFKAGNYEAGILQAEDVIKKLLLNSNDPDIVALKSESSSKIPLGIKIYLVFFIMLFFGSMAYSIWLKKKHPEKYKLMRGRHNDSFYRGAAGGLFIGGFGRGGLGGSGGFGGFSGGGGGFGGGGFGGKF